MKEGIIMGNFNFGNYICEHREKRGLSQSELGARLGVTNKAVSKWENGGGYPSTELMLPLAKELGVSIEELYKAVTDSKIPQTRIALFLQEFSKRFKTITIICGALALIPYILYAVFSTHSIQEKGSLMILTPIICIMIYGTFLGLFFILKKNPFSSNKILDYFTLFFIIVLSVSFIPTILNFVVEFPNGYYIATSIEPISIAALVHLTRRRYK